MESMVQAAAVARVELAKRLWHRLLCLLLAPLPFRFQLPPAELLQQLLLVSPWSAVSL